MSLRTIRDSMVRARRRRRARFIVTERAVAAALYPKSGTVQPAPQRPPEVPYVDYYPELHWRR